MTGQVEQAFGHMSLLTRKRISDLIRDDAQSMLRTAETVARWNENISSDDVAEGLSFVDREVALLRRVADWFETQ